MFLHNILFSVYSWLNSSMPDSVQNFIFRPDLLVRCGVGGDTTKWHTVERYSNNFTEVEFYRRTVFFSCYETMIRQHTSLMKNTLKYWILATDYLESIIFIMYNYMIILNPSPGFLLRHIGPLCTQNTQTQKHDLKDNKSALFSLLVLFLCWDIFDK